MCFWGLLRPPISRQPAKCAMTFPWIHSGARSAPLCTHAVFVAHFAGRREIGGKFPMRAASVDPKSTQLTPLTISPLSFLGVMCCLLDKSKTCFCSKVSQNGRPGRWETPESLPLPFLGAMCCLLDESKTCLVQKSVKTAVLDYGRPLRALVLTKLVE